MNARWSVWAAMPIALVVIIGTFFALTWWRGVPGDGVRPDAVDVRASGPVYDTIDELAGASDRVVHVVVVDVDPGRAITAPGRPDAGVVTQLVQLEVVDGIGDSTADIVVEQEASLLDGTPVIVNGLRPLTVGDEGIAFLVTGGDADFPYAALVNEQAWLPVIDDVVVPSVGVDVVESRWIGRSVADVLTAVESTVGRGTNG